MFSAYVFFDSIAFEARVSQFQSVMERIKVCKMFQLFIGVESRNDSRCWKCTCLQIYEFMIIMHIYVYNKLTNSNTYIDMYFSIYIYICI